MPFGLVNKKKSNLKSDKRIEETEEDILKSKVAYFITPYNKSILNRSNVDYIAKDNEDRLSNQSDEVERTRELGMQGYKFNVISFED